MATVDLLPNGQAIHLVDREQLRFHGKKQLSYSSSIQGFVSQPTPPPVFDLSKGETIKFPILGNDQRGNCYYTAACHLVQCFNGLVGRLINFDTQAVIRRYDQLSPRDGGLNDNQMIPEFKAGIVGPNGPHKIIDDVQVDPDDDAAVTQAMWLCSGLIWTTALRTNWMPSRTHAGSRWTNDGGLNRNAGHAMILTGKNAEGNYDVRTWGLSPCVTLTPAGLKSSGSELLACASLEQFDERGFHPCGLHYLDVAPAWKSLGFTGIPANPFPEPSPEVLTYVP